MPRYGPESQIEDAGRYAFDILDKVHSNRRRKGISYHDRPHTEKYVYPYGMEIGRAEVEAGRLPKNSLVPLGIELLFHDTGFYDGPYDDNEPFGAAHATRYMTQKGYPREMITLVTNGILLTNPNIVPGTKPHASALVKVPRISHTGRITKDSDVIYLGLANTDEFFEVEDSLRREVFLHPESRLYERVKGVLMGSGQAIPNGIPTEMFDLGWHKVSSNFMRNYDPRNSHRWQTRSVIELFGDNVEKNIAAYLRRYQNSRIPLV
ncbi:MAG: hypothetical protein HYT70_02250 [Candidatus Aenigmarchaeota archaeon]|nr:hypothetical protein [Candidatus Aenigmarchaeota archaeon]